MEQRVIAAAQRYWLAGRPLDAGRVLYENLPVEERPAWAAAVLAFAYARSGVIPTPEIEQVIRIARTPARNCGQ